MTCDSAQHHDDPCPEYLELRAEIERLKAALEPFQRNVEAVSLSAALGHIGRKELWDARRAYEQEARDD